MSFFCFLFFVSCAVIYILKGKSQYNLKDWLILGLKFFLSIIVMIVFGFIIKGLSAFGFHISIKEAKVLTGQVGISLVLLVGLKFLVVALCSIFSQIIAFHKKYNTVENYRLISNLSTKFSPVLLIGVKLFISAMSVLIYYGIWLGSGTT